MKKVAIPFLDPEHIYTPILEDHAGKFSADRDPADLDSIVLTFETDDDASAFRIDLASAEHSTVKPSDEDIVHD